MTLHDTAPFPGAARANDYIDAAPTEAFIPEPVTARAHISAHQPDLPVPAEVELDTTDLGLLSIPTHPSTAQDGVRGLLGKVGIKVAPSTAELARLAAADTVRRDEETIRQATWTRAVSVLVANRKGGTGKTPTAVILGGTLAAIRGGSVAVMEVSDDPGTLTFRAEGSPRLGIGELVRDIDQIRSAGQLAGYTAPQTSFASVIGTIAPRPQLTRDDVTRVAAVVDEFYSIRVMDSGNQPSSSAFEGAVDTADVLVIPVLNSADVILEAIALLDHLRAAGGKAKHLADTAVVIRLTDGRLEHPHLADRLTHILDTAHVGQVFEVPYDPHIAERGQITLAQLAPATRAAFTAATAGVVRTLHTVAVSHHHV